MRGPGDDEMERGKENSGSWEVEGERPWLRRARRFGLGDFAGTEERERKWPAGRRGAVAEAEDEGRWESVSNAVHGATRMKLESWVLDLDVDGGREAG